MVTIVNCENKNKYHYENKNSYHCGNGLRPKVLANRRFIDSKILVMNHFVKWVSKKRAASYGLLS